MDTLASIYLGEQAGWWQGNLQKGNLRKSGFIHSKQVLPTLPSKAPSEVPTLPCQAAPLTCRVFIAFPWHWVTWAHIPSSHFLDQVTNRSLPDTHSANVPTKACLAQPSRPHPGDSRDGNESTRGHHLGFLLGEMGRRCGQTGPAYMSCPHLSWRVGCPLLAEEARESSLPEQLA